MNDNHVCYICQLNPIVFYIFNTKRGNCFYTFRDLSNEKKEPVRLNPAPYDLKSFRKLLFLQDPYRLELADGSRVQPAGDYRAGDDDHKCQKEPQRIGREV